jgi:hypothetical protein
VGSWYPGIMAASQVSEKTPTFETDAAAFCLFLYFPFQKEEKEKKHLK